MKTNSPFPFFFPRLPSCFEKCNVLNLFNKCIKDLPDEVQIFLKQKLQSPVFVRRRMQAGICSDLVVTDSIRELFSCIELCEPEQFPYVVAAISILSCLPVDFILEENDITLEPKHLIIVRSICSSAAKTVPTPFYTQFDRIESTKFREVIPTTYNWTIPGNPFIELPKDSKQFIESCHGQELPEDFTYAYRFTHDLSEGFNSQNGITPVPCINDIDYQWPRQMRWIANLDFPQTIDPHCVGCDCHSHDCRHCHDLDFEDGRNTMHYNKDGTIDVSLLSTHRSLIIECNDSCSCDPKTCNNRVIQHRAKIHLCLFHALTKSGWGVRSLDFIPCGTFVCEYLGEVITDPDVAEKTGKIYDKYGESYLFDLDAYDVNDMEMITVDPRLIGNVSKFINHNCEPNLVSISIGTCESRVFHRIAFFSTRDIYPNEDLGFHYGYKFDIDMSRMIPCNCGSLLCRSRLR